jgi:hypothetical protein
MKIYVGHASSFDYQNDLYAPIKKVDFYGQFEFIFPHEFNPHGQYSKDLILNCDRMIAEVSFPSTGLGIEVAWALSAKVPIFCIAKQGSNPSTSISQLNIDIFWYSDEFSLINNIKANLLRG